uniref:G-protein coupled receptors family 1 profile domain-containing protein n=1 Tax=Acrobeloides nanus TaxID=290746 RepID=A0A914DXX5_9BILA
MHLFRLNDSLAHACALNQSEYADDFRVLLVGFVGSGVAVTSILENLVIFYVFSTSRKLRRQNYANPVLLALFDIIVSVCYIFMASMQVIAYRYEILPLIIAWVYYLRVLYCLQHFALSVSNFLLVVASIERYLANGISYCQKKLLVFMVSNKIFVFIIILIMAAILKVTLYFETDLLILEHCPMLDSIVPIWIENSTCLVTLRLVIRKCFTIFLPFFILAYCNLNIVLNLKKKSKDLLSKRATSFRRQNQNRGSVKKAQRTGSIKRVYTEKRGVRVATRTLVMVVGCYLISNFMTTIINIWEYFDKQTLRYEHYYEYLIASDIAYLLTIVGCALRLPIYVVNDHRIRKAILRAFIRCRYRKSQQFKDITAGNLEKWSIVIVSNSLRSNLTGVFNQEWSAFKGKKSFDELGNLLQEKRTLIVQMAINLANANENNKSSTSKQFDESILGEKTCLTDIQEEDSELLWEHRRSIASMHTYSSISNPTPQQWRIWQENV